MATTAIWDVKGRIDKVLSYAQDKEKTNANLIDFADSDIQGLRDIMNYTIDDYKTEKQLYISGINCFADIARQQMMLTKQRWQKLGGNSAYHAFQSFAPGEVTPELAHKIGVELATELWGDRFEVVVATHLNTDCIHSHFVINSVSFKDGGKYNDCKETMYLLRNTSDFLCEKYGLSVIKQPGKNHKHYAEWMAEKEGSPTWRSLIANDVDAVIAEAKTWRQFLTKLHDRGYEVKAEGRKYVAVRPLNKERFVRLKTLGSNYTEEAIKNRLLGFAVELPIPTQQKNEFQPYPKLKGLKALYYKYLYMMGFLPQQKKMQKVHPLLKDDILKAETYLKEYELIMRFNIESPDQLFSHREILLDKIKDLSAQRNKCTDPQERKALNKDLNEIRKEVRLCQSIYDRSKTMQEKLDKIELEENEPKEEKQHDSTFRRNRTDS